MKLPPPTPPPVKKKIKADFIEGFAYLKKTPDISTVLLMLCFTSLLVLPYNTLLPVFAKVIFKGNAATFGYINSFIGMGAVSGSIFLASLKPGTDLKIVLLINSIVFGISLMLFSHTANFPLAMLFAVTSGFGMMSLTTIIMTIIQVNSDKEMRGRVMSYVAMGYFGMLPMGSLLIGAVSQHFGAPATILCEGIVALIITATFSRFLTAERVAKKNAVQANEL
jgi:MFS family permease